MALQERCSSVKYRLPSIRRVAQYEDLGIGVFVQRSGHRGGISQQLIRELQSHLKIEGMFINPVRQSTRYTNVV